MKSRPFARKASSLIITKPSSSSLSFTYVRFTKLKSSTSPDSPSSASTDELPEALPTDILPSSRSPLSYTSTLAVPCNRALLDTRIRANTSLWHISFFTIYTTFSIPNTGHVKLQPSSLSKLMRTTSSSLIRSLSFPKCKFNISLKGTS